MAVLSAVYATAAVASDGLRSRGKASRDDSIFLDSYQYKLIVPYWDYTRYEDCNGTFAWDHEVHPNVPHSVDKVKFTTCFNRPVTVDAWNFTLMDTCEDSFGGGITIQAWNPTPFGTNTRVVDGFLTDVIDKVEVSLCLKPPRDYSAECWGEWINKPVWDYEWIVKIPWDGIYDTEKCGAKFEEAIKKECAPFEMTKFDCEVRPPGAWIRFRHNLLCGRTRIQNAIKKASNGDIDVRCPYFAEVPVPS
ncbi:hypothetical protein CONLIGDRAFT_632481 [Coniochaeta ligniaria NRRL 30616]|uniref:Uncharacterized protein n=1 Tax=Coniochaeta ligniaria NRRL 30616 TaxID=1408157 RepID=A0A1J7ILU0_9PEZI|nr:hypothetical protein CONLIGDRAFT_632481 [Coniochaeta ligniaria NRRL 30616]